ncbi:peptidase domain-containing ABC transporter [Photorhabdus luminescens]|uniref:Peptidase domain-containing ABC transporter n=1 Tax=Photorhabdus luminescens subsp. sonorensis TaxID=1173677 RepID=A0A5C4RLG2_PHOLU|nr:peptidase domain-containing ABC transporter [Photorhabdus luminescens]TNH44658.1 peptidase domain-containing ABC transporter [Photorhabdus luminescens subsp. sonorensis]
MLKDIYKKLDLGFKKKVPQFIQNGDSESGLVCIAMVGYAFGIKIELSSLRQRFGSFNMERNISGLAEIVNNLGMQSRALSLELDELHNLKLPCILNWDMSHFVVLVRIRFGRFIIHDPEFGRRVIGLKEVASHFTGVALELWPNNEFKIKVKTIRNPVKLIELFNNVQGIKAFLVKLISLSIIVELVNILLPIGTQLVMDHVILSKDKDLLVLICLGLIVFTLFRTFASLIRSWFSIVMGALIEIQWKNGLFNHLMGLPLVYFEKRKLGDIQSRFNSLDVIRDTFTDTLVRGVIDSIMVTGVFIMMLLYGGWLLWVVVGFTLIYTLLRVMTYEYYQQASHEQIVKNARSNSHLMETLYGITTLKVLGLIRHRSQQWLNLNIEASNSQIRLNKFDMIFAEVNALIVTLEQITVLGLATNQVINESMTVGMFVAFNAYRGLFADRTANLINIALQFRMLSLHNERISDIALSKTEEQKESRRIVAPEKASSLEVKNLTFRYDEYGKPIINNLNLCFEPGESVAIVGPSGIGKTTLMKLMAGLIEPAHGEILFNNINIMDIGLNNYRKHIACVLQEDKLFSGSISENISGFDDNKDEIWVEKCAILSNIHQDILKLPMKYETMLSELGGSLSGGQKQRLLIARALYRRPNILFMDEATSHLDIDNEASINAAISALSITRIIIAHRPSTIACADRVITLSNVES